MAFILANTPQLQYVVLMVALVVVEFLLIGQRDGIVDLAVLVIGVTAGPDISNSVNTQLTVGGLPLCHPADMQPLFGFTSTNIIPRDEGTFYLIF